MLQQLTTSLLQLLSLLHYVSAEGHDISFASGS